MSQLLFELIHNFTTKSTSRTVATMFSISLQTSLRLVLDINPNILLFTLEEGKNCKYGYNCYYGNRTNDIIGSRGLRSTFVQGADEKPQFCTPSRLNNALPQILRLSLFGRLSDRDKSEYTFSGYIKQIAVKALLIKSRRDMDFNPPSFIAQLKVAISSIING